MPPTFTDKGVQRRVINFSGFRLDGLADILPRARGASVLDIGCSSGFFSLKLKELGAGYVLGIDHGEQPQAIEQARQHTPDHRNRWQRLR